MPFILSIFARWGLPEWLRKPLAYVSGAIALFALLWLLKGCYDDSVIDDHEAEVTKAVATQSAKASTEASNAVDQSKTNVEKTNADARNAASRSDDPLGAGLRKLRDGKGSSSPAPR